MTRDAETTLELDDIQSGVLRPRPAPYAATYIVFRIDDGQVGRELMRRASTVVTSAANPTSPLADTWVSVAVTYQGLKALGVPPESLESFAWEFRQGMAARAKELGDTGESGPEILGRNGTYVAFRKLHQRVAAFRRYLKANSASSEEEELLAAKMMGRWRSGAPLALCPAHDDPALGGDLRRNNDFLYEADDPAG